MEKAQEEGTGVNHRGKFKEDEKASEEGTFEQSNKELLEDRMKCIAVEIEIEEEERSKKKTKKRSQPYERFPISRNDPTREHLLIREAHDAATKWETDMRAKYMGGQVSEMLGRIMENVNNNTEFPTQPYHNWSKELMDHAKTGWFKFKELMETAKKYPMQNLEQVFRDGEWILYDRSGTSKKKKRAV